MKQHAPVLKSHTVQRQASAHAGATSAPDSPRQRDQGHHIAQLQTAPVAQLAGGKVHHRASKKKYLADKVGEEQEATSAKALAIKKASPVPISNKEAKRQAKGK
ncbi:hypothetical protein AACH06_27010 [Ideonella sp. DXS29W]|uniref:Uncharacterized protein n=1 Tax=Ideonella lacteola TaxID=2984193 RepID=A0ABU9BWZ0_9BURK